MAEGDHFFNQAMVEEIAHLYKPSTSPCGCCLCKYYNPCNGGESTFQVTAAAFVVTGLTAHKLTAHTCTRGSHKQWFYTTWSCCHDRYSLAHINDPQMFRKCDQPETLGLHW